MKAFRIIMLVGIFFFSAWVNAQENLSFHDQLKFSDYLLKNNLYDDSKAFIHYYLNDPSLTNEQKDSLYFFAGQVYYNTEIFDTASTYYGQVNDNSNLHNLAAFNSSFCLAEDHNYEKSKISFSTLEPSDQFNIEFLNFELLGAMLLARDTSGYSSILKTFTYSDKEFADEEIKIIQLKHDIENIKHKSGFIAGCMSAVIPGLGKVYAGKIHQGLTSFFPITILGVQAYEAYRKAGVKSVRFILSAGLFSVFYIGNIWGSVLSVSVNRTEINNEINNQILLNMRIPLQGLSGKN
jgi:hypothetical protein